jgi:transposase InsO family protein
MAAIRRGVQRALFQLGRIPEWHQTDNSTSATHRIPAGKGSPSTTQNRTFNVEYVALMKHFGMKPRTTEVGAKEQNGDIESTNGALKRSLVSILTSMGPLVSHQLSTLRDWLSLFICSPSVQPVGSA